MRGIRVAVAGLGFGTAVHVPGFRLIPGVEVFALLGQEYERTQTAATGLEIPHAVCDPSELLSLRPDVVSIALPPAANAKLARFFLGHGIPVLLEKPIASNLPDALELKRLADRKQVPTAVDFQFSEIEAFRQSQRILKEAGAPLSVKVLWQVQSYAHREGTLKAASSWKIRAETGGGALNLMGTHFFYLAEWFLEPYFGPIVALSSKTDKTSTQSLLSRCGKDPSIAAEDSASITLEFESGAKLEAEISNASSDSPSHQWIFQYPDRDLSLSNFTFDYMNGFHCEWIQKGQVLEPRTGPSTKSDGRIVPFSHLAGRFVRNLGIPAEVRPLPDFPTLRQGVRVQLLTELARKSLDRQVEVS